MTDRQAPSVFYEIRLSPFAVLSLEALDAHAVPRAEVDAFADLLDRACDHFTAQVDFLDLHGVTLDVDPLDRHAASVVITIGDVHAATLWLLRGRDADRDRHAVDQLHEGLGYLALRFEQRRALLPIDRLPAVRPAAFMLLINTDDLLDPIPILHRLVRALAVAYFRRGGAA